MELLENVKDEVPQLNVKLVGTVKSMGGELLNVHVLLPRLIARTPVPVDDKELALTALLLVVNVPAETVRAPVMVKVLPKLNVAPVAVIVIEITVIATEVVIVGVPVSIKTVSALVGTEAPPVPPDVADQLVVVEASHVPDPPTQYLAAINYKVIPVYTPASSVYKFSSDPR